MGGGAREAAAARCFVAQEAAAADGRVQGAEPQKKVEHEHNQISHHSEHEHEQYFFSIFLFLFVL